MVCLLLALFGLAEPT